ncbi:hypothetical protein NHQ30_006977 [Ciborinia camelliae]|nr:hypothetical protein NHQ30_006977 [Ciborinia camelliae]
MTEDSARSLVAAAKQALVENHMSKKFYLAFQIPTDKKPAALSAKVLASLYTMTPATVIEAPPSPEVLFHRRSSEIWSHVHDQKSTDKIPELSLQRSQPRHLSRSSLFKSSNQTEANEAWNGILAGHGVVALPESYAKDHHLPQTSTHMYDGDTEAKRIYFIEAYHAMHFVRMLRDLYHSYQHCLPLASFSPPDHDYHCFDRLSQYIMCNPDYTLVPNVAGHSSTDFWQPKKMCMDWDGLRDWAEKWHGDYFDMFGIEESQEVEEGYNEVD